MYLYTGKKVYFLGVFFCCFFLASKVFDLIVCSLDVSPPTSCLLSLSSVPCDNIGENLFGLPLTSLAASALQTIILFVALFLSSLFFYTRAYNHESEWSEGYVACMKLMMNFFVVFSIFGPMTNVRLMLRDYHIIVIISFLLHIAAVIVVLTYTELVILSQRISKYSCLRISGMALAHFNKEFQFLLAVVTFAVYYVIDQQRETLRIIYLILAITLTVSICLAFVLDQTEVYQYCLNHTTYNRRYIRYIWNTVGFIVSLINFLSLQNLLLLTIVLFPSDVKLYIVETVYLTFSIFLHFVCFLFKYRHVLKHLAINHRQEDVNDGDISPDHEPHDDMSHNYPPTTLPDVAPNVVSPTYPPNILPSYPPSNYPNIPPNYANAHPNYAFPIIHIPPSRYAGAPPDIPTNYSDISLNIPPDIPDDIPDIPPDIPDDIPDIPPPAYDDIDNQATILHEARSEEI